MLLGLFSAGSSVAQIKIKHSVFMQLIIPLSLLMRCPQIRDKNYNYFSLFINIRKSIA